MWARSLLRVKHSQKRKGDLAGTAGPHDRSVFLCFKNADAWLPHVEEDDPPKVVSTALKTRKDNITVKYSCMICVEKQEEKKQPGLGEVLAVVVGLSMVIHDGAAGDPLQPLEKAEKQWWMLIASVAFGWGEGDVTIYSNNRNGKQNGTGNNENGKASMYV
ncbi:hypothetical protein POTOM_016041 [Populus tomentosa]|uniref:Uncharacterized protein n=1 Tax=Populus tomentosa TaxID=118781 RepID=A0A8X8D6P2_POPTO|nr:hypothetical protein POTOM_016041 [Populus tomentosa]